MFCCCKWNCPEATSQFEVTLIDMLKINGLSYISMILVFSDFSTDLIVGTCYFYDVSEEINVFISNCYPLQFM